jgi:comEA protein
MNKKPALKRAHLSKKVMLTTSLLLALGLFSTVHAQQSVVENPMLSSSPVRYGSYSSSVSRVQSQPTTAPTTQTKTAHSTKKQASTGTININNASETDLVSLPGIGPSKARAIAEFRQKQGGFKSIEDLQQVKGIGPATLEKLRAHVTL